MSRPQFVWIANWVRHATDPSLSLRNIPGLTDELWSDDGQRAWQYAGDTAARPLLVAGLEVDISLTSVSVAAPR